MDNNCIDKEYAETEKTYKRSNGQNTGNDEDNKLPLEKLLNPTRGMSLIYRSATNKQTGKYGEIYGCIYRESVGKYSQVVLVVKYPDGSYSDTIIVKQSELFEAPIPKIIKNTNTPLKKASVKLRNDEQYGKEALELLRRSRIIKRVAEYSCKDFVINYVRLFYILQKYFRLLPERVLEHKSPLHVVYIDIVNRAEQNYAQEKIAVQEDYYNLTTDDMKDIAYEHGYEFRGLMKELTFHDMLKVDSDRKRFQKKVTYKNKNSWVYSIKKEEAIRKTYEEEIEVPIIPYEQSPKCYTELFKDTSFD